MNDENIKKNVIEELYWDNRVDASDIKATVNDRKVRLEGTVPTYYDKKVVERDAWNVSGVKKVENKVSVKYRMNIPLDNTIEGAIKNRITWNPHISSFKIDADVKNNVASLTGTVDAYWKKMLAESEAENVSGIVEIHNNIAVVPTNKVVDEAIAKNVVAALKRKDSVNPDDIDVRVENGEVTLTGQVSTWLAYFTAKNAAEYTPGVTNVHNKLDID